MFCMDIYGPGVKQIGLTFLFSVFLFSDLAGCHSFVCSRKGVESFSKKKKNIKERNGENLGDLIGEWFISVYIRDSFRGILYLTLTSNGVMGVVKGDNGCCIRVPPKTR